MHTFSDRARPYSSKHVLHCELHDPWATPNRTISRRATVSIVRVVRVCRAAENSPKRVGTAEISAGQSGTETIRHVERFSSNFDLLLFLYLELSRYCLVPLPVVRSD